MMGTLQAIEVLEPCPNGEASHAVRQQHRTSAGSAAQMASGLIDLGCVAVDGAEYRLQGQRDERDAFATEALHPWIPQAAVAKEAVDEKDPAMSLLGRKRGV